MIKDAQQNKYMLEAVKSRDPGHAPSIIVQWMKYICII